ncbi:MAG: methyltransferase, partial [Clostridia bacterium]
KIVELCSGSGVISILIAKKFRPKKIVAVEIQSDLAEMSERSIALNDLQEVVTVVNADLINCHKFIGTGYDIVVVNPPYRKQGAGEKQEEDSIALCRHEIAVNLSQVIAESSRLLNSKGSMYLVHQAERLTEIVLLCHDNKMEVKELTLVCSHPGDAPNLVLARAVKDGKAGVKINAPIIMFDEFGEYTHTVKKLYSME